MAASKTSLFWLLQVPDTRYLRWSDWCDLVVSANPTLRALAPNTFDESEWRTFVERLHKSVPQVPDHAMFESWQSWAEAARQAAGR